ncbi:MAG: hypothetical protein IKZ91_01750 [Bacteroidales bacterium]|nr:hypothetical protein [Bacteroidales bacterium]
MFSDLCSYYYRWYHERPVLITPERTQELRRLHAILVKCAHHLCGVWQDFLPLGSREAAILQEQSRYPLKLGTWRPDYLAASDGSLRLCEITSRFFAHGIFLSWFSHEWARSFLERFPQAEWDDRYGALLDKMKAITAGRPRMYVLKSADRTSEIRLYKRFYEAQGISVSVLESDVVERHLDEWAQSDCFLVGALNQVDIMWMEDSTLRAMMECGMYSDFRNIFLVHDKRFMSLWFDDRFTGGCLSEEETAFLRAHSIPTFNASDKLPEALADKDAWIVKPCRLGKSEGVRAGAMCSKWEWRRLLRHPEGYIIQPFIPQRTFPTTWEGKQYLDYICGMMLCVDDDYFDSGLVRCSSLPVTNVGDDRKAAVIHSGSPELVPYCDVL